MEASEFVNVKISKALHDYVQQWREWAKDYVEEFMTFDEYVSTILVKTHGPDADFIEYKKKRIARIINEEEWDREKAAEAKKAAEKAQ